MHAPPRRGPGNRRKGAQRAPRDVISYSIYMSATPNWKHPKPSASRCYCMLKIENTFDAGNCRPRRQACGLCRHSSAQLQLWKVVFPDRFPDWYKVGWGTWLFLHTTLHYNHTENQKLFASYRIKPLPYGTKMRGFDSNCLGQVATVRWHESTQKRTHPCPRM